MIICLHIWRQTCALSLLFFPWWSDFLLNYLTVHSLHVILFWMFTRFADFEEIKQLYSKKREKKMRNNYQFVFVLNFGFVTGDLSTKYLNTWIELFADLIWNVYAVTAHSWLIAFDICSFDKCSHTLCLAILWFVCCFFFWSEYRYVLMVFAWCNQVG